MNEPVGPTTDTPASDSDANETPQTVPAPISSSDDNSSHFMPKMSEMSSGDDQAITWKASEFHAHDKSLGWYILLLAGMIGLAAILYLITKSVLTPAVVIVGGIILGVYASKRPDQVEYALDQRGIRIGSKQYLYTNFRLLILITDSSVPELSLIPNKRFMPSLSVHYLPDNQDAVLNMLSKYLPLEERRLDFIDRLMARIRY